VSAIARLRGVGYTTRGGAELLRGVDLTVRPGEHWAIVGSNGAGKSTLLKLIRGMAPATAGEIEIAGEHHRAPGLRDPRLRIGVLEGEPARFAAAMTGREVVTLRPPGPIATLGAAPSPADDEQAREVLALLDGAHLADRAYATCSHGERQRILLARALMRDPVLILLDEPVLALDLPSRESLLLALEAVARRRPRLATITVTHHIEELPRSTTHALLLRDGTIVASGPVDEVLADESLSDCFGIPIAVTREGRRWLARLAPEEADGYRSGCAA
jgi:iron complex transport system ATP-binding protein